MPAASLASTAMLSGFLVALLLVLQPGRADNNATIPADNATVKDDSSTTSSSIEAGDRQQHQQQRPAPLQRRQLLLMTNDTSSSGPPPTFNRSSFVPSFQLGPVIDAAGPLIDIPRLNDTTEAPRPPVNRTRLRSPFNNLGSLKFENGEIMQKNDKKLPPDPPFRPSEQDFVKFVDTPEAEQTAGSKNPVTEGFLQPIYHHQASYPEQSFYNPDGSYANGHQQYVAYESKPSMVHHHHHTIIPNDINQGYQTTNHLQTAGPDDPTKPEMVINVHPVSYQSQSYDMLTKPKTVIYVTTHDEAGRKFPTYLPNSGIYDHPETTDLVGLDEPHYQYPIAYELPHHKSISPWKKILHVIGAFLPLGLLFALLSPKVITVGGPGGPTTSSPADPGVVISKLRVDDLPAEHKSTLAGACSEERLVCRLLAASEPAGSRLLRELLKHVTDRTAESAVRKKELDRIFEAAKLGNCDILTCNFYDDG